MWRKRSSRKTDVEGDVAGREAELAEPAEQMTDLAGAQQRLGGDASPVEADAAEVLTLDERHREPELARTDRRRVPAGPATDHHHVVGRLGHPFEAPLLAASP